MRACEAGDSTRRNKSFDGANRREDIRRIPREREEISAAGEAGVEGGLPRTRTHTITHTFMNRQLDYRFRPLHRRRRRRRHLG